MTADRPGCVHVWDLPEEVRPRLLAGTPGIRAMVRAVGNSARLTRMGVCSAPSSQATQAPLRVAAGDFSTAFHAHDRTDEWVYLLSGKAHVRVGDAHFDAGPADFLAHAAGGPAHSMQATTDLEYLMGGMIDPDDIVLYPDAGLMRKKGELVPME
jgi:hypothetical protein